MTRKAKALGFDSSDFVFIEDPLSLRLLRLDLSHLNIFGAKIPLSSRQELRATLLGRTAQ